MPACPVGACGSAAEGAHARLAASAARACQNGSLRKHLRATAPPWPVRVALALQIARALAYLHRNHIIHRDVKTDNVLMQTDTYVKLADFGFARYARPTVLAAARGPASADGDGPALPAGRAGAAATSGRCRTRGPSR